MKEDFLVWSEGRRPGKVISKGTLNHPSLIEMVSGLDICQHTREAYLRAYEALGIDLVNRVPIDNAPLPTPAGQTCLHPSLPYRFSALGVFDTAMRQDYAVKQPEEVFDLDLRTIRFEDLVVPVPHSCRPADIRLRQQALGAIGQCYPLYCATLFMWAVEVLGWEIFLVSAATELRRFDEHFLRPCVEKSKTIVREIAETTDCPFVFLHDDLASASGPMFRLSWYDEYIFPHYPAIFAEAKQRGKKLVVVADGNMTAFLDRLAAAGADGIMYGNPATPIEEVLAVFGQPGRFHIGGVETVKLTTGSPSQVRQMVFGLATKMEHYPGFAISSCGGLDGNIPLENLEAYFGARAMIGATPGNWRTRGHI